MITKYLVIFLLCVKCATDIKLGVVGGGYTSIRSFPHSAFLGIACVEKNGRPPSNFCCGSAILNQKILLTAAHCFYGCHQSSTIIVKVGSENRNQGTATTVKRFILHEEYVDKTVKNDVALASLERHLTLGPSVSRVVIMRQPPGDKLGLVAGWGKATENGAMSTQLKATKQSFLTDEQCKHVLGNKPAHTMCGIDLGKKSHFASGDSGSALVIRHFIQVGIVSYRSPSKSSSIGVYTKVSAFYDWIAETAKRLYCSQELL